MTGLTPKQEKFAQKYIELGNAAEAYRNAYDAENMKPVTVRRKAAELLQNGNVAACVRDLRERHYARHAVTVDSLTGEYEEARRMALEDRQASAAVSATTGKAKLHGLIVDRNEVAGRDGGPVVVTTADDAIIAQALSLLSGKG